MDSLLRGLLMRVAGWLLPPLKLPVTIWGSSMTSPEEPTCMTLYMTMGFGLGPAAGRVLLGLTLIGHGVGGQVGSAEGTLLLDDGQSGGHDPLIHQLVIPAVLVRAAASKCK